MHRTLNSAETIVARATAPGNAALAIVRLSGNRAPELVERCFRPGNQNARWRELEPRRFYLGRWIDPQTAQPIDEVQVVTGRAPHSYTGEDACEIHCHGGAAIVERLLQSCLALGARLAEPGEFTRRAYLNGRIDLAQAEAVADLIRASTETGRKAALQQLSGALSQTIKDLRGRVIAAAAEIEARLDFSDEDINPLDVRRIGAELAAIRDAVGGLIASARRGRVARDGARVAICGRPNSGKSSLLNALCGRRRALVTPHPGTTRDAIECELDLKGFPITFIDTAGIRESDDPVERLGVELARNELAQADLALWLIDASTELSEDDIVAGASPVASCFGSHVQEQDAPATNERQLILVLNKSDLPAKIDAETVLRRSRLHAPVAHVSALTGAGLEQLIEIVLEALIGNHDAALSEGLLVTNLRHAGLLARARDALARACEGYAQQFSGEFVALDLNEALAALSEILGENTGDAVLDQIFRQFCIGK